MSEDFVLELEHIRKEYPGVVALKDVTLQLRRGEQATFEMQIIFRQHTSWQGVITWLEEKMEQSFRSVLELILLMDSALRKAEGSGSPS